MNTPQFLQLAHADAQVAICPDMGGTLARFTWRGHEILRPAPDTALRERLVRQMACYPLVPYSNRIGNAELIAGSQSYRLRANAPPESHALHGFGWQRAWQVASCTADTAELQLDHAPDVDWPFACDVTQRIRLVENTLHMCLSVCNRDTQPMPVGLGFHPYFPKSRDTQLQTTWKQMWTMDAHMLPDRLEAVPSAADFSQSRRIDDWHVDNCFTGWNRCAVLDYGTHRVQLDASSACRQLVCFSPADGRPFIALEPVTNINNGFALAARGVPDTGTEMLAPGGTFAISISISVSALSATSSPVSPH